MYQADWVKRIDKQLNDDAGGYGKSQSIAIFGHPGIDKFEFVMTGRHLTVRCDGHSTEHVAFGGPIFYGHDAGGSFDEAADHPGNVFWPQALEANKVYQMLDERHKKLALVEKLPVEQAVGFHGLNGPYPGCPVTEFSSDQKTELQRVLTMLLETLSHERAARRVALPERTRPVWTNARWRFTRKAISATIRCGTAGGWKARRWFGISAARRTCMFG